MASKAAKKTLDEPTGQAPLKASKLDARTAICKEFECSERAAVKGYCRLHFLKLARGKSESAKEGKAKEEDGGRTGRERRRANRLLGLDYVNEDASPDEAVENMGNINVLDINTVVNMDDSELPSPNSGEMETPMKKTGS